MRKPIAALFAIAGLFLFITHSESTGSQIQVEDMSGRSVRAPLNPKRIVCLGPGSLRQIVYLGRQDRLVGIEQFEKNSFLGRPYMMVNPHLAHLPVIAPGGGKNTNSEPDLEATLRVKPEVIFISYMEAAKADSLQKKLGIPVVVLSQGRFAGFDDRIFDSLKIAARVLGVDERAEAIRKFVNDAKNDLSARVGDNSKASPSVYVGGVGFRGQQGIESSDADYTPLDWVKANHVVKSLGKKEHVFTNKEQLLAWNPEVILVDGSGLNPVMQDYRKNPDFYKSLRAIKDSRTYILFPFVFYVANVDTALVDSYVAGKILYPDRFADIEVKSKSDEIYRFFLNEPAFDLMEKDFGFPGSSPAFN